MQSRLSLQINGTALAGTVQDHQGKRWNYRLDSEILFDSGIIRGLNKDITMKSMELKSTVPSVKLAHRLRLLVDVGNKNAMH